MSRWFRHYAGMMRDEKLVRVALRAKQPIERVVWVWGAILESAAEIDDGGRYDLDPAEVAYFLRTDEADVCAIERCLDDLGRVASSRVVKWGDRQFQSDRSTDRVKAHRDAKRRKSDDGTGDETTRNADVTFQGCSGNAPETETETETDKKGSEPSGSDAEPASLPDPIEQCWSEGVPSLVAMQLGERQARSCIGRWLKDTGNDGERVLGAIQRARDHGTRDPIPLVGRILNPLKTNGPSHGTSVHDAARALEKWARDEFAELPAAGRG